MSADRNSTNNYQQEHTYGAIGTNDIITTTGDMKQDDVDIELNSYRVITATNSRNMPHTKTMILQSSDNGFKYVHPQPTITTNDYNSSSGNNDEVSESGDDGYDLQHEVSDERNGQSVVVVDPISHYSQSSILPQSPPPLRPIDRHQICYGRLSYNDTIWYIDMPNTTIGRNSSTKTVDFHVCKNIFVSREHLLLTFDQDSNCFYLDCLSKNGIFVDQVLQRYGQRHSPLPKA